MRKTIAILLTAMLLAGCNAYTPETHDTLASIPTMSVIPFEEKAYTLSDLDLDGPYTASYMEVSAQEYLDAADGVVLGTVGRIRIEGENAALDIKVDKVYRGFELKYMQLLLPIDPYTIASEDGTRTLLYQEGMTYVFSYNALDSLRYPETLYFLCSLLYMPSDGENALFFNEETTVKLPSNYAAQKYSVSSKADLKEVGISLSPFEKTMDIADFADVVAVVDILEIIDERPYSVTARARISHALKGDGPKDEFLLVIQPDVKVDQQYLICMDEMSPGVTTVNGRVYTVAGRSNAFFPLSDKEKLQKEVLPELAKVEGIQMDEKALAERLDIADSAVDSLQQDGAADDDIADSPKLDEAQQLDDAALQPQGE